MNQQSFKVTPDILASKGLRFANYIIDIIVFYMLFVVFGVVSVIVIELVGGDIDAYINTLENVNPVLDRLITWALIAVYYFLFETLFKGRTVGKFITKTKVVMLDGSRPPIEKFAIRSLCRIIPFEQFSFLGADGKGWHDAIPKTFVVEIQKFEDKKKVSTELDQLGSTEI